MSKTIVERDFWNDNLIIDKYSPEDKLFMLYLMTCPRGSTIGIFKLPIKLMAFEIGYSPEAIRVLVDRFQDKYGRIKYNLENQEIAVKNTLKYSISKGGKPVEDMVARELREVENADLLIFVYQSMVDFWNKSQRAIDKSVKILFENEISRRSNYINANANANANAKSYPDSYDDSEEDDDFNISQDDTDTDTSIDSSTDTWRSQIINSWNKLDVNIPKMQSLNAGTDRYKMTKARINENGIDKVLDTIKSIDGSTFLKGYVNDFVITFDWFIRPNNFVKVMEGNYLDKSYTGQGVNSEQMAYAEKAREKRFEKMLENKKEKHDELWVFDKWNKQQGNNWYYRFIW